MILIDTFIYQAIYQFKDNILNVLIYNIIFNKY